MKAMMSEKLRNILNDPQKARELQRLLGVSSKTHKTANVQSIPIGNEDANLYVHRM